MWHVTSPCRCLCVSEIRRLCGASCARYMCAGGERAVLEPCRRFVGASGSGSARLPCPSQEWVRNAPTRAMWPPMAEHSSLAVLAGIGVCPCMEAREPLSTDLGPRSQALLEEGSWKDSGQRTGQGRGAPPLGLCSLVFCLLPSAQGPQGKADQPLVLLAQTVGESLVEMPSRPCGKEMETAKQLEGEGGWRPSPPAQFPLHQAPLLFPVLFQMGHGLPGDLPTQETSATWSR